ncbi:MAG: restriction endonuclease [Flavipsychrobacter sp.]|nr:restriction endonuclease [Flavipsychrobacter sp.]
MSVKTKSPSRAIAEKTIFSAFSILKNAGGQMRGKAVVDKMRETVQFDEYEKHIYEKTGYVRWESLLHFYTIDCMKAGYLLKENGVWILTNEGTKAIALGPEKLLSTATQKYRAWSSNRHENIIDDVEPESNVEQAQQAVLSQFEETALDGIRDYILKKTPYEFQNIVAYLLSAMGYYIAHIAEKGPDGGIDIIAYNDPLGAKEPRLIVQVKHRPYDSVPAEDIQKLVGTMKRGSDVGIFVTSGQFSKPSKTEARTSHKHIELIDLGRFIKLWIENYSRMNDEQKNALPLHPIYFLGSNE